MRILSPLRKGPFGFETLNDLIFEQVQTKLKGMAYIILPIMIASNDYDCELFNGETGVLVRKLPLLKHYRHEDRAFFPSKEGLHPGSNDARLLSDSDRSTEASLFHRSSSIALAMNSSKIKKSAVIDQSSNGNHRSWREFSPFMLPKYTLAYCLSVHKSQGSEFDKVVLVLPEGSETFGKEVLYTAITRAKKSIEIFGSDEVLEKTFQNESLRLSGITHRWTN